MDEKEKERRQREALERGGSGAYTEPGDTTDWDMPDMREPDFSDVRKKIFSPWKVILFIIISSVFWIWFFFYSGK